jgi:Holliday junction resolvasome RuvABC ATP-dependent DNA helicase subunit
MHLIVLCGPPGVGKLSIARDLAERMQYRVFHNHLTVDLLESLFDFGSKPFVELRERLWIELLTRAADEDVKGVIFTLAFDRTLSPDLLTQLAAAGREHDVTLSFVELSCAADELDRRMVEPERRRFGKLASAERYRELALAGAFVRPCLPLETMQLDTTALSVAESAERIYAHLSANVRAA